MVGEVSRCLLPPFLRSCPSSYPFVPSWSLLLPSPPCGKFDAEVQEESQDAAFYPSVMFQRQTPEALGTPLMFPLLSQAECPGTWSLAVPSQVRGGALRNLQMAGGWMCLA